MLPRLSERATDTALTPAAAPLFQSFFMGGFECSTHRLASGKRLDLVHATRHDEFALGDYRLLRDLGIRTVREGLRWHLIESTPRRFDFSSAQPMTHAARETGMQVIWDLWHYGWPDDIDIFSIGFIRRFTAYARAAAALLSEQAAGVPFISPINEISFFSWAGGDGAAFYPFARDRGAELKRQLVRASVEAIYAIREVNPAIRFCQIDPIINVTSGTGRAQDGLAAERYRQTQFDAWDMISGRTAPELGGEDSFLDIVGVNYYIHNQWAQPGGQGSILVPSDPRYRHVRDMLAELYARYRKPIVVAETGIEDETRPIWLRYISNEVAGAIDSGVPVEGLCLYPIVNHPGWDDDRHCYNGLFDSADDAGDREVYQPLADELGRQQEIIAAVRSGKDPTRRFEFNTSELDWAAHVMQQRTDETRIAHDDVKSPR
ncbi:hypothetical protein BH18VER1_BH18VER1_09620 [soil metagenome]